MLYYGTKCLIEFIKKWLIIFWKFLLINKYNIYHRWVIRIEQKGMTFDHDFCSSILLFFFPLFKEGRKKRDKNNQSHAFLLDQLGGTLNEK